MRIGISLLIASTLLLLQGCAAVVATTEAAKIVGKTTVGAVKATAKVVTWPVREAVKIHKESQKAETPPVTTVQHGQADAKPTRTASASSSSAVTTTDGDIKLANATDEDEDTDKDPAPPPSRRKKSGSSTSSSSGRVADPEDSSLDDPPPTTRKARQASVKSSDDDDVDSDLNGTAKPAKKAPNWRSKKAVSADSSDPDTIRIQ